VWFFSPDPVLDALDRRGSYELDLDAGTIEVGSERLLFSQGRVHTPHRPFSGVRQRSAPEQPEKTAQSGPNGSLSRLILVCRLPTMSKAGAPASLPADRRRLASRKGQAPRPGSQRSS